MCATNHPNSPANRFSKLPDALVLKAQKTNQQPRHNHRSLHVSALLAAAALVLAINAGTATRAIAQVEPTFEGSDPCRVSEEVDTTVICSGDWSQGVKINNVSENTEYDRLELSSTEDGVTPARYVPGVEIITNGSFTIETKESDRFTITTEPENAPGIYLSNDSGSQDIDFKIKHYGDIFAEGSGSYGTWVRHGSNGSGSTHRMVSIEHDGNITTRRAHGINLDIKRSGLDLFHQGAIHAGSNGIVILSVRASDDQEGELVRNRLSVRQIGDIDTVTYGGFFGILIQSTNSTSPIWVAMKGNIDAGLGGIVVGGADGGDIHIDYAGQITTFGTGFAYGISARGSADNSKSNVTINAIGGITSAHERGIIASTQHGDSASHITLGRAQFDGVWQDSVTLLDEEVVQGSKIRTAKAGIHIESGASTIDLYNDVTIAGDESDIQGAEANDEINNYGIFTHTGKIDLAATTDTNIITNHQGATFNSGTQIILMNPTEVDSSGTFINSGDLSPGGIEVQQLFEAVMDEGTEVLAEVWTSGIQTTQITGNFEQNQSGILIANIDTGTSESDRLEIIGGSARLAGRLLILPTERVVDDPLRYVILTASDDEISGELELILNREMATTHFSEYEIDYSQADEVAVVSRNAPTYSQVARSQNQKSLAAGGLNSLSFNNEIILNLHRFAEGDEDGIRNAYDLLTGEVHPSVSGLLMATNTQRSDAILQRQFLRNQSTTTDFGLKAGQSNEDAVAAAVAVAAAAAEALGVNAWWMQAQGGLVELDSDDQIGTADTEYESSGLLIGADHSNEGWMLGAVIGLSQGDLKVDERFSSADIETWSAGLYGSARLDASVGNGIDINFGALGNWHSVDTSRTVAFELLDEQLEADFDATSLQAFAEIGANIEIAENTFLHPFASIAHTALSSDGYTETAAGGEGSGGTANAALTVEDSTQNLTTTTIGLRVGTEVEADEEGSLLRLQGMVGWRRGFGDLEPQAEMSFDESDVFLITGAPLEEDAFITELGLGIDLAHNIALSVTYRGQFSEASQAHSLNASLIGRF